MAAATLAVSSVASARGTKRAAWLAPSSGLEAALPLGPSSQGVVLLGFFPTCCRTQDDLWFCHSHDSGFIVVIINEFSQKKMQGPTQPCNPT